MLKNIFEELGLSSITQNILEELVKNGPATARQLSVRVAIPRTSAYDHLKVLQQKGLVLEKDNDNKKVFCVDNIKNIEYLLDEKIKHLETERREFKKSLPSLLEKTTFIEPKIKFYSGKEGVRQVIHQIMLSRNVETVLMWPMSEMMKVLGKDYLKEVNEDRIHQNISLRVIWPEDKMLDTKKYPFLGTEKERLRTLRIAPKGMSWDMGYWVFDDKVALLSSEKEGFGFIIHSRDYAKLMKVQFEAVWNISTPTRF